MLDGAEGRHATTVRRLRPGERVDVTDGAGLIAQCEVVAARPGPGQLDLTVLARRTEPAPRVPLTVVQAILKGDRGELAVELMTEVGADVIVPWAAERCVARWPAGREDKALARWRSTALAAGKQSRRARFSEVTPQERLAGVVQRVRDAALAVLLDPQAGTPLSSLTLPGEGLARGDTPRAGGHPRAPHGPAPAVLAGGDDRPEPAVLARGDDPAEPAVLARGDHPPEPAVLARGDDPPEPPGGGIVLIVGPEGGLTEAEEAALTGAGAVPARLGPTVLRGSTAGAVAAALVLSASGRWG